MQSMFNLDDLPAKRRFSHWREIADSLHVPVSVKCDQPDDFSARWNGRYLGQLYMGTAFVSGYQFVERTAEHIRRSEADPIGVWMPLNGNIMVRQDGRETIIRPGQFGLVDPARPYEEATLGNVDFIWVQLLRQDVVSRIGATEQVTATCFSPQQPIASLAIDFVRGLSQVWDSISGPGAERVSSHAFDMLTLALMEGTGGPRLGRELLRSAHVDQVKAFVAQHLHDPMLSVGRVAAGLGLGESYVRELRVGMDLDFPCYVNEQRLKRCADALADRRLAHYLPEDIGRSWGFSGDVDFREAFRTAYGMTPKEYRTLKLESA